MYPMTDDDYDFFDRMYVMPPPVCKTVKRHCFMSRRQGPLYMRIIEYWEDDEVVYAEITFSIDEPLEALKHWFERRKIRKSKENSNA